MDQPVVTDETSVVAVVMDMMGSGDAPTGGAESVQPWVGLCPQSGRKKVSLSGAPGCHFLAWLPFQQNRSTDWRSPVKLTLSRFRRDWRVTYVAPGDAAPHSGLRVLLCERGLN